MPPDIEAFDHIHVYVADRAAAEVWYRRVLGFTRTEALAFWATDGGPLTLQNASGSIHLALFERPRQANRAMIALRASAAQFTQWLAHLRRELDAEIGVEDHALAFSLYFKDPDGNPYEITTYEYSEAKALIA
jgi:catechol-2,3-dioxygenase